MGMIRRGKRARSTNDCVASEEETEIMFRPKGIWRWTSADSRPGKTHVKVAQFGTSGKFPFGYTMQIFPVLPVEQQQVCDIIIGNGTNSLLVALGAMPST